MKKTTSLLLLSSIFLSGCAADILGIASTSSMRRLDSSMDSINSSIAAHSKLTKNNSEKLNKSLNEQKVILNYIENIQVYSQTKRIRA